MSRHGATLARRAVAEAVSPAFVAAPEPLPVSPWPARKLPLLAAVVVLAGVVLGVAWYGCSGETVWHVQIRWFGLGVLACAVNAAACLIWLAAGLRELRKARAWTLAALHGRNLLPVVHTSAAATPSGELVTAPRMRRYHRADCPLMAGKAAVAVPTASDLTPCGICGS
jgi:hypothetical protein